LGFFCVLCVRLFDLWSQAAMIEFNNKIDRQRLPIERNQLLFWEYFQ